MIDLIATGLSMTGAALVAARSAKSKKYGFVTWIIANTIWIFWAVNNFQPALMLLFSFYLITATFGWLNTCED